MKLPFRCLLCCIVSGARAGCEKDPDCPKISCKCNGCVAGNVSEDGNQRKQGGDCIYQIKGCALGGVEKCLGD